MHPVGKIRFALGVAAALCALALRPALLAEDRADGPANPTAPAGATSPGQAPGGLLRFELFLDQHPNIEARLAENPAILNNQAFQRNHPVIAQFLARHPAIGAELAAQPRWFVHRELARVSAAPVTREQLAGFDHFLDLHPGLDRLLVQHPRLLQRAEFLHNNPELHEYLKRHPAADRAGEFRPERTTKGERRN